MKKILTTLCIISLCIVNIGCEENSSDTNEIIDTFIGSLNDFETKEQQITTPKPDTGFVIADIVATKGESYEYRIYEMQNEQLEYYFEIVVLQNGEEIQTIRQEQQEYASLKPQISSLISEVDVDFDENNDILIHMGNFGAQGVAMYTCYTKVGNQFAKLNEFSQISNPQIFKESQLIQGNNRGSATTYEHKMYEFIDGVLVNTHRLTLNYENNIATEEELVNEQWMITNNYTNWENEIFYDDTYWSILSDHWKNVHFPTVRQ